MFRMTDRVYRVALATYHWRWVAMDLYSLNYLTVRPVLMLHRTNTVACHLVLLLVPMRSIIWRWPMKVQLLRMTNMCVLHGPFVWCWHCSITNTNWRQKKNVEKLAASGEWRCLVKFTQINNWVIGKLPIAQAKCNDVRWSRALTVEFTSSVEHLANANTNARISDLKMERQTISKWGLRYSFS